MPVHAYGFQVSLEGWALDSVGLYFANVNGTFFSKISTD